jgi:predicted alpha/beta-fold hydrolase
MYGQHHPDVAVLRQLTIGSTYTREIKAMRDGGCIALDWWRDHKGSSRLPATTPIVLILHGLSGPAPRCPFPALLATQLLWPTT